MNPRTRTLLFGLCIVLLALSLIPILYFTVPALIGQPRIQLSRSINSDAGTSRLPNTPIPAAMTSQPLATTAPVLNIPLPVPSAVVNNDQETEAAAVLNLVNIARANEGLGRLSLEPRLMAAALEHSEDQAENNTMTHDGSDGTQPSERVTRAGYPFCMTGENVAMRFDISSDGVFEQWWNSPPHHENMMTPEFIDIGIGYALSRSGDVYYTMVLGTTC